MKDSIGQDLERGDLLMITIDTPLEHPAELIIYLSHKEIVYKVTEDGVESTKTINTIRYYPISEEGLEVAKHDAGISVRKFYRTKGYEVTNMEPRHLRKFNKRFRGHAKDLYESIINLL
jgi:hypothetical protein